MIVVRELCKSFGDHLVLDHIDEHIRPGEKVVVIGPSGSGKSTFLRCLNLLETPTSGSIRFDGLEITRPRTDIDAVRRLVARMGKPDDLFSFYKLLPPGILYNEMKMILEML